jgi:hypothetical protein
MAAAWSSKMAMAVSRRMKPSLARSVRLSVAGSGARYRFVPRALPRFDRPRLNTKQWVAFRSQDIAPLAVQRRIPHFELHEQMSPLILDLVRRHGNRHLNLDKADLAPVERIAANLGLGMDALQIRTDDRLGCRMGEKPLELRMIPVAASRARQHGTSQQRFAPERDEPLRVEIPGVQGPETHGDCLAWAACRRHVRLEEESGRIRRRWHWFHRVGDQSGVCFWNFDVAEPDGHRPVSFAANERPALDQRLERRIATSSSPHGTGREVVEGGACVHRMAWSVAAIF